MTTLVQTVRRVIQRREPMARPAAPDLEVLAGIEDAEAAPLEVAPNDPLVAYFQTAPGAVDVDSLELDSPALAALKEAGVKLVVPLVSQGELIGLLNLGSRLSEQEYSSDDKKLLDSLAAQAAPALQVAQLVRRQAAEARERERIEGELRIAQLIQQNYLPRGLPDLPGWQISAFYRPAREVGGDFYDFIELPEGQVGFLIGDVTDKGVPAAMVMAATRSVLRATASRLVSPGAVLERVNELMCPDMPPKMFVTCLYGVVDPLTGSLRYANAGHNVPYVRTAEGTVELRATGMPLGLLPGMAYEEKEAVLGPGETILLTSDGVAEAHGAGGEMFSLPRLAALVGEGSPEADALIDRLMTALDRFTGAGWEQEDDITLVTLHRAPSAALRRRQARTEFSIPSEPGNERLAIERVVAAVAGLGLAPARLERLKTAVGEATMNAIEHGNENRPELTVEIEVQVGDGTVSVRVTDQGGDRPIPEPEVPDLDAKLAGLQTPRGWGLFLIRNMVDDVRITSDGSRHTVELVLELKGGKDAGDAV